MALTYRVMHDLEIEAAGDERDRALANELRALGYNPADDLAARIEYALTSASASVDVDDAQQLEMLARALDHRRNAAGHTFETPPDERDFPRPHATLRDHLIDRLGYQPLTYKLAGWEDPPAELWSYTGTYSEGDRIVTGDGREWRVARVTPGEHGEPGTIDVESWRSD